MQIAAESPFTAIPVRRLWWFYAISAAAFLPALGFYYVGEEAILPLVSLEMWFSGDWTRHSLFGADVQHNPLFNWILIGVCGLAGWENMLPAARSISIASVIATGLVLAWLARRLFGAPGFGALAAVVYMMLADIALYRGWLAYSDPLFGLFIFSATAVLWVASRERRVLLLAVAVLLVSAAVLVKAFTAYVFYGTVVFVLLFDRASRDFLLGWRSLFVHAAGAALIAVWFGLVLGAQGQGARMFNEILDKLRLVDIGKYMQKLVEYPLETLLKLSPAALLALYYAVRGRREGPAYPGEFRVALLVALLSFLPYWIAPESHSRYLVPVYPWFALVCACVLARAGARAISITGRWWGALIAVKLVLFLAVFPYYQKVYRGENYAIAARGILERTAGHPLYTTNDAASGLSVAAHIAVLRLPAPPIAFPPPVWDTGFVISYTPDPRLGQIVETYRLGGNDLYLLCRGSACGSVAK